jgi:hypothetical protein
MKTFRVSIALIILLMLSSGCAANSILPTATTQSPYIKPNTTTTSHAENETSGMISPAPSVGETDANETALPTPSKKLTDDSPGVVRFNEDNLLQYFQFGMSYSDVQKRLKDLKIWTTQERENDNEPGWSNISTDNMDFNFDSKNQLYLIGVSDYPHISNWETAKGLKIGDSLEQLHFLYGKEDELDELHSEYIYYKNGYMLSIRVSSVNGIQKVDGWSFFVNIWNEPSISNLAPGQAEGDFIAFNEDNFLKTFPFGMSHKNVEKKLNDLGVRITWVISEDANDDRYWEIDTDHVSFYVDFYTDGLDFIEVKGWDTAKGLKEGDSIKRLHQLYGKEYQYDKDDNAYIYKMRGYRFRVNFVTDNTKGAETVSEWFVYNNQ